MTTQLKAITGATRQRSHGECFIWTTSDPYEGNISKVAIDAGNTPDVGIQAANECPQVLILTHSDKDHTGGAVTLIKEAASHPQELQLKELWVPLDWILLLKARQYISASKDERIVRQNIPYFQRAIRELIHQSMEESSLEQEDDITHREALSSLLRSLKEHPYENIPDYISALFMLPDNNLESEHFKFAITVELEDCYSDSSILSDFANFTWEAENHYRRIYDILYEANNAGLNIRFFSVDEFSSQRQPVLARLKNEIGASILNAIEVRNWHRISIDPDFASYYQIALLTVQNRRALSVLLWPSTTSFEKGAIIWSDTDGRWLNRMCRKDVVTLLSSIGICSAPHHGSANAHHEKIWDELLAVNQELTMICAGGIRRQRYNRAYFHIEQRCCTRCRHACPPHDDDVRDVYAELLPFQSNWTLAHYCK